MNYKHLFFFVTGYVILFILLFSGYRYVLDADATGYFSVAEHLAKGDYQHSLNGIWSPLGSWILAPFLNLGFDAILTQKYLNGLYGLICLIAYFYLLKKLKLAIFIELAVMTSVVLLVLQFVVSRMFGDLLQLVFLLFYLNIICSANFNKNYRSILLAAVVGALGFYAKAYIFYFTLLHLPLSIYLSEKYSTKKIVLRSFLKKTLIVVTMLLFIVSFWIFALQSKYGHFTIGEKQVTGTLSTQYHQPRVIVYPPAYKDSYSAFDDISSFNLKTVTPFTSFKLFVIQLKIILYNFLSLIENLNEFSYACVIIILLSIFFLFFKKKKAVDEKIILLLSFIAVYTSGYLLFHIESRFLWIVVLCVLALSGILFFQLINLSAGKKLASIFCYLVIGSFCIYPIIQLKNLYGSGRENFAIADALKKNNIKGNILTGNQNDQDFSRSIVVNYLAKCRHFGPYVRDYTTQEILETISLYQINYFIFYYSTPFQKQLLLTGELTNAASFVYSNIYPGIIVLAFKKVN